MRRAALAVALLAGAVASAAGAGAVALASGAEPLASAAEAEAPGRVVSINLCTDQMAMLTAAPGQLVSVSFLARDPESSVLWAEAAALPVNHGLAEEVFALRPDLVLAGTFTSRTTVAMLRRLGIAVEEFPLESSFADIRANLTRMGDVLGREAAAAALVAEFDARLKAARPADGARPRAAPYYAASYTSGAGTLTDEIIAAAGLANIAAEAGLRGMTRLPLEVLTMATPDLLITGAPMHPPSLAQAVPEHPALRAARAGAGDATLTSPHWTCGAPFTADAVRGLAEARDSLTAGSR